MDKIRYFLLEGFQPSKRRVNGGGWALRTGQTKTEKIKNAENLQDLIVRNGSTTKLGIKKQIEKQHFGIEEAEIVEPKQATEEIYAEPETFTDEPKGEEPESRAKQLNGDARKLVLHATGTEEKKPNVVTRTAGSVVKAMLEYEGKHFTSIVPLMGILREKIQKVNENEGNKASWELVKSDKAAIKFINEVAREVGTV